MPAAHSAAEARFTAGTACLAAGDLHGAEAAFASACALAPALYEARLNLAYCLSERGAHAAAEHEYRQLLAAGVCCVELFTGLSALLIGLGRDAEAEPLLRDGLRHHPQAVPLLANLGALLTRARREEEARAALEQALALEPDHTGAHHTLAYLLLRAGNLVDGFAHYEARLAHSGLAREMAQRGIPLWQGEALAGRSVLIGLEAGFGDMIQFARYARELKALGARRVELLCLPAQARLFASLDGIDHVYRLGDAPPAEGWDCWIPPMSLPQRLGTTLATVPAEIPYLHPEPAAVAQWQARLPAARLRIGLVWRGNPRFENDAARSLPGLHTLAPLWELPGVHWVSLQKDARAEELAAAPGPLFDAAPWLDDFADTAAALTELDLLISVDTASAHLAGALGIPCWLLLPAFMCDWRWLREGERTPWYPAHRLFRQEEAGNWQEAVKALKNALAACY